LNVRGANVNRHRQVHTADSLETAPISLDGKITAENLNRYKSPGTGHIPSVLIQAGRNTLRYEIQELINSVWNKEKGIYYCTYL